tara:strand:+ start:322421 stop:322609 length:189 start_codon:yes stop_codon:yes gene_type:complete
MEAVMAKNLADDLRQRKEDRTQHRPAFSDRNGCVHFGETQRAAQLVAAETNRSYGANGGRRD